MKRLLLPLLLVLLCGTPAWAQFPVGWTKWYTMTIDHTKVGGSVTISNYTHLATEANMPAALFSNCDNGGGDLRASTDSTGATQLPMHVVSFNTGGSTAQVYVKVPSVSPTVDTTYVVWCGNTGQTQPAHNTTYGSDNAYDANYVAVWHNETSSPADSTANGFTCTGTGTSAVAGQIGNALSTPGTTPNGANCGTNAAFGLTTGLTLEGIVKPGNASAAWVFAKTKSGDNAYGLESTGTKWAFWGSSNGTSYNLFDGSAPYQSSTSISTSRYDSLIYKFNNAGVTLTAAPTLFTHGGHVVYSGAIYSFGGHTGSSGSPTTAAIKYNPNVTIGSDTWTAFTNGITARWGLSCVLVTPTVYCIGGATNATPTASTANQSYDLSGGTGGTWASKSAVPSDIANQGIECAPVGTTIYCASDASGTYKIYAYDTTNDAGGWPAKTSAGTDPGTWGTAVSDGSRYIYFFGGSNLLGKVMRYDSVNDSWNTTFATTPYAAWAEVAEYDGSDTIYFGFGRKGTGPMSRDLYTFTISTQTFTKLASDSCEGDAFAAGLVTLSGNLKLHVMGKRSVGSPDPGTLSNGYYSRFDATAGTWDTTCPVAELWVNGVLEQDTINSTALHASAEAFYQGQQAGALWLNGKIDEARVSNIFRPAGYALTEYNNLLSPATFATAGALQTVASSAAGGSKARKLEKLER